jgi:hypothetical protein
MVRRMSTEERIRAIYVAFNDRAIDDVLAAMADDVDWPNGWEGGRMTGREAVREYWLRQWQAVDPRVEPVAIAQGEDGRWTARVHQVVRSPQGEPLADGHVRHVYAFRGDLVARMDIEPAAPGESAEPG